MEVDRTQIEELRRKHLGLFEGVADVGAAAKGARSRSSPMPEETAALRAQLRQVIASVSMFHDGVESLRRSQMTLLDGLLVALDHEPLDID